MPSYLQYSELRSEIAAPQGTTINLALRADFTDELCAYDVKCV